MSEHRIGSRSLGSFHVTYVIFRFSNQMYTLLVPTICAPQNRALVRKVRLSMSVTCFHNYLTHTCTYLPPVAAPPTGIQMVSVFNPNNTLRQLEISWIPVVRIVSGGY